MVSIIIVNYNGGVALKECVEKALHSNLPVEIKVVDNASTDPSILFLESTFDNESRLQIIKNQQNQGFAKAVNLGLTQTNGDFVLILNPDCFIENDTLQHCVDFMRENQSAGMCGVLVCDPDGTPQQSSRRAEPLPLKAFVQAFGLKRFFPQFAVDLSQTPLPLQPIEIEGISGAFMFVRREALDQINGLDEGYFLHCEDLDWFKRFRLSDWKLWFLPHVRVIHLKGACSSSQPLKVELYKHRGMVRYYKKFFSKIYPKPLLYLVIFGVWMRFSLIALKKTLLSF
jgi:GT2 family glycosyltransferase